MASRIAERRAARSVRQNKRRVARRKAAAVSVAERVRQISVRPLYRCLMHGSPSDGGIVTLFLAREAETGQIAMGAFLVDAYALGIKDVIFEMLEPSEFAELIATASAAAPVTPVTPAYARKLVRDANAYGATLGLRPPRNFAAIEALFGDVRAEDCNDVFVFGRDGKPFYVVGPTESVAQVERRLEQLTERLGPDGFDFVIPGDDDEYGDDDEDIGPAALGPPPNGA